MTGGDSVFRYGKVRLGVGDTYYRIVRNAIPTVEEFRTGREEGRPLVNRKYLREWAEGVSVYDNREYALKRARTNNTNLGRYVAVLVVEIASGVEVRQTSRDRHHYTIYASGQSVLDLVRGDTIPAFTEALRDE